ncbi:MAG: DUF3786 domain-containing protein [Deltaproteobacteria bacterium]|nr:DUF3786 domain-containing protein [Deltaproteobacteria bacterium]
MPTQLDYETARQIAVETLLQQNLEKCCVNAGLLLESISPDTNRIRIPYIGHTHTLTVQNDRFVFNETPSPLKISDEVLLLHYLITATGVPVSEEWITFREVPSGPFYYASFVKRAIVPLVKCFGERPSLLNQVSETVGQVLDSPGDIALKVFGLPRVPVVLSLWKGDEEFPPEANVYLDKSISSYLSTEDIAYLSGAVVYKTIGISRQLGKKS